MMFFMRDQPEALNHAGTAAPYVPLVLMVMFLQLVLGSRSAAQLYFSPAEIDFLFAGPFHRRDLLLFHLFRKGMGLVLLSLAMSLTPFAFFFPRWLSFFVGLTLSLAFLNLASLAVSLARLIVAERAHTRARKLVLILVTTMAAVALPQAITRTPVFRFADLAASFRATWPGRVLLAPFEVFSNAMLAERWFPDLAGWAAAAAAIDLALRAPGPEARRRLSRVVRLGQPGVLRANRAGKAIRRVRGQPVAAGAADSASRTFPGWAGSDPTPGGSWC